MTLGPLDASDKGRVWKLPVRDRYTEATGLGIFPKKKNLLMTIRLNRLTALVSALALGGACLAQFTEPAPLAWRWAGLTYSAPGGQPITKDGKIYVAVGGRMYCIDQKTGNTDWRFPSGQPTAGEFQDGIVVGSGKLVGITSDNQVYAVDVTNGNLLWQVTTQESAATNAVIAGNYVVYGTTQNHFFAMNLEDGSPAWKDPFLAPAPIHPMIEAYESNVLYTTQRGDISLLNPIKRENNWSVQAGRISASGAFDIDNDRIYVNTGSFLACLRGSSGRAIWQKNVGSALHLSPAASSEGVATMTRDGHLFVFNRNGSMIYGKGINLFSPPVAPPIYRDGKVILPLMNGAITMVEPASGEIEWTYTIPPISNRVDSGTKASDSGGGPGIGGAGGRGGPGAAGGGLAGGGGNTQDEEKDAPEYTQVAGKPAVMGNSLVILTRDGSVLLFDTQLGVDATAPQAEMLWPTPGNEVAGKSPMTMIFKIEDLGIGVKTDSIKVTIDGADYIGELSTDGFYRIRIGAGTVNKELQNGRHIIKLVASDWLGNSSTLTINLSVNNNLPAVGSPPVKKDEAGGGGLGGGLGRGGGGGGVGGLGG